MSVRPMYPGQVIAQIRPLLERLDASTGSATFTPVSFHPVCTSLGISHSLRPDLWRALVEHGYVTDAGNGQVCITEQGCQLVAVPRRQR